jgi:predicted nucleotidyltransferase
VKAIILSEVESLPVQVYLFGSWARGEERRTSNIDIGIVAETPLSRELLTTIRTKLEESTIPYQVDVVDLTRSDRKFVEKVRKEGIIWKIGWNENEGRAKQRIIIWKGFQQNDQNSIGCTGKGLY